MKKLLFFSSLLIISLNFSSCVKDRDFLDKKTTIDIGSRKLIHYWNFNDTTSNQNLLKPTFSIDPANAKLSFDFANVGGTSGYNDFLNPSTNNLNLRNGDSAGALLRVRNPSLDMIISMPTQHHKNILLQYAVSISSITSAPLNDSVFYSTDGINFTNQGLVNVNYAPTADPNFTLVSYDLSSISAANDNPNLKFKIVFANGNLNTKGNTRFDNITVDADTLIGSTNQNHFPVAINDNFDIRTDSTLNGNVSLNDLPSADGGNSWSLINSPLHGNLIFNTNGVFNYSATSNYVGLDSFDYKLVDTNGDADTARVIINVREIPTQPAVLIHYWNFNSTQIFNPTLSLVATASISLDYSNVTGTITATDSVPRTDTLRANAQNNDTPGNALRARCPINAVILNIPTTNYKNIVLAYAESKSSSGPSIDSVYYSIDGINYTNTGMSVQSYTVFTDPLYNIYTFDFSFINALAYNNPNFKFKIVLVGGTSAASGNNRFDNITVKGVHL